MSFTERVLKFGFKFEKSLGIFSLCFFCLTTVFIFAFNEAFNVKLMCAIGFFAPLIVFSVKYSLLNDWLESRNVHGLVAFSGILIVSALCLLTKVFSAQLLYTVVFFSALFLLATPIKGSSWSKVPAGMVTLLFMFAAVAIYVEPAFATQEPPASTTGATGGLSSLVKSLEKDIGEFSAPMKSLLQAGGAFLTFLGVHDCYKAKQGQGDGDWASGGKKIIIGAGIAGVPTIAGMGTKSLGI